MDAEARDFLAGIARILNDKLDTIEMKLDRLQSDIDELAIDVSTMQSLMGSE